MGRLKALTWRSDDLQAQRERGRYGAQIGARAVGGAAINLSGSYRVGRGATVVAAEEGGGEEEKEEVSLRCRHWGLAC